MLQQKKPHVRGFSGHRSNEEKECCLLGDESQEVRCHVESPRCNATIQDPVL